MATTCGLARPLAPSTGIQHQLCPPVRRHTPHQISKPRPFQLTQGRRAINLTPTAAAGDDEMELAVFRFTLGIPGFDDSLIPRVVGIIGAALIVINHIVSPQPVSAPQARVEALGAVLGAVAIAAPTLQRRLEELKPGRGRQAPATQVEGGKNVFALDESLKEEARQDLAWASYAILKNTNTCGMFVAHKDRVLLSRGILGADIAESTPGETLNAASRAWSDAKNNKLKTGYFADRGQITREQGLRECALIPSGALSVLVLPLTPLEEEKSTVISADNSSVSNSGRAPEGPVGESVLVLVSERERALSRREIAWAQGVAARLHTSFR